LPHFRSFVFGGIDGFVGSGDLRIDLVNRLQVVPAAKFDALRPFSRVGEGVCEDSLAAIHFGILRDFKRRLRRFPILDKTGSRRFVRTVRLRLREGSFAMFRSNAIQDGFFLPAEVDYDGCGDCCNAALHK
jgi:hypothetical protein